MNAPLHNKARVIDVVRRVSSLGGRIVSAESTMTLEDQDRGLLDAVVNFNRVHQTTFKVGEHFDAIDQSGFTFAESPTMAKIVERIEAGVSAGVAFAYFDRSGRNWWAQGPFFSRLEKATGLFIVAGMEAIDYRSQMGRQLFGSMSVASEGAHFAAKDRGENIATAVMARKVPNRIAYGQRRNATYVDGKVAAIIDADRDPKAAALFYDEAGELTGTSAVVHRIYALRLDGYGVGEIVRILNNEGVPGTRGGLWVKSTVSSILRNPVYKGTITLGRRKRDRSMGTNIRTAYDPAIAIVSDDEWKRAQTGVKMQRTGTYKAGVAGGLLHCESCGETMSVIGSDKTRRLYGCRRGSTTHTCPRPVHVTKGMADDYVDDLVESILAGTVRVKGVGDAKKVGDAKAELDAAVFERDALTEKVSPAHESFATWMAKADARVDAARGAHDDAVALAGRVRDLPTPAAYRTWSDVRRNTLARDLLRVVVAAPTDRRASGRAPLEVRTAAVRARLTPEYK